MVFVFSALALLLASTPGFGVSKEIIQLQTQVQQLQDQMARMQQAFDERMGVMRSLVEQQTDAVNKVGGNLQGLQRSLNQSHAEAGQKNDQVSGQIQALNDSLDELKARLAKVTTKLDQIAETQQNLANPAPAGAANAGAPPAAQAPPPDMLYNNALRDFNAGKLDLATSEFADYMKYYPTTDLAGNAQFYLAEIAYRQSDYAAAVKAYDKVLEQYPGGNKTAAAQLKKGMAMVQLGQRQGAAREFNGVVQRYPRSNEATTAREQLKKLGVAPRATR